MHGCCSGEDVVVWAWRQQRHVFCPRGEGERLRRRWIIAPSLQAIGVLRVVGETRFIIGGDVGDPELIGGERVIR